MKRNRWFQLMGPIMGLACSLAVAGWINQHAFGQSSKMQTMERQASKDYLPLTDEKRKEVRARAEKFYGTSDLPNFTANAIKVGHVGKGVIDFEAPDHSELQLDVDPCNSTMEVFV